MPFRLGGSGGSCRVAHLLVGTGGEVAAAAQVEDGGGRNDRHQSPGHGESPAVFLAPALGAVSGHQAEGTPAGEHHGVHALGKRGGIQGIRFMGGRATAADVNGANRAGRRQHHGHAGEPAAV
ncbi:hypothetical protein D9M72_463550 [compost metagenome]